jgi:protein SMG7
MAWSCTVFLDPFLWFGFQNPKVNDYAAVLKWFLDSALGFYVQLLQALCSVHGFDAPGLLSEKVEKSKNPRTAASTPKDRSVTYAVHSCLVHLGDVCRYLSKSRLAGHYYRHAATVLPSSGQPFNQLALLEAAKGEVLSAVCLHARSLAVRHPFPAAAANLSKLLAKFSSSAPAAAAVVAELDGARSNRLSGSGYSELFLRFHAALAACETADRNTPLPSPWREQLQELTNVSTRDPFKKASVLHRDDWASKNYCLIVRVH